MGNIKPSFEKIIEDNKSKIFRICSIYAVSPLEPEDLFQDITVQIWKALPSFEGKSNIATWVYRIALNVCMRSNNRSKNDKGSIRLQSLVFEPQASSQDDSEDVKHKALHDCINQLAEAEKSIVILSLEGLAYKEISEITGLTENHVAVKMKRIRKSLLTCINSKLK